MRTRNTFKPNANILGLTFTLGKGHMNET
jgi:hypothetical protein